MMKETDHTNRTHGKIAMVGTPCQILAASKMDKFSDYIGENPVELKIGLFCMENFSYKYMKELLKKYNIDMKEINEFRIEKGHLWFFLTEERVFKIPLDEAKKCIRKNCQICMDFTSEFADISVGSVGSSPGWSTVIVRSKKGLKLLKMAESDGYIKTRSISESGLRLIEKLAQNKKNENKKEIQKREDMARPVLYRRQISKEEFENEVSNCQFTDLKGDVIDIGACVLCGACLYACPEDIIQIEDRKPQSTNECPEGCNTCYLACPRTYIPYDLLNQDTDKDPLGDYIKIVSAKAPVISGQDGGVVTALLSYVLSEKVVEEVLVVDKSNFEPWKPAARVTNKVADVLKASGTKYAACPIFKSINEVKDSKSQIGVKGGI